MSGVSLNPVLKGYMLPGLPHLLLSPDANPGWRKVRTAMDLVAQQIDALNPDVLLLYSTYWPSVIGHQIQANPRAEWVHVDDEFHALGSMPYVMEFDRSLAHSYVNAARARKLQARAIEYKGFPIDTGSVVVGKIINPNNRRKMVIVSSNVYADRAETLVLGKAAQDALIKEGKTAVAIVISSLSNRLHEKRVEPKNDHIHSLKDQEWNAKFLEFLEAGRLEDVSQLSRQFHKEARVHKVANFKPFWWLAAAMGQSNLYAGEVLEYQPIYGSGAAVVGLTPASRAARDLEFDEADPNEFSGERNILGGGVDVNADTNADRLAPSQLVTDK